MSSSMSSEHQGRDRLALFVPCMAGGGAERVMLNLAREFSELGYSVDMVLATATGPYLSDIPDKVRVVDLGASRVLSCIPAFVRYLRRERPVALLSTQIHANVIAVWARYLSRMKTRVVLREAITLGHDNDGSYPVLSRLIYLFARTSYRSADSVIAVSNGCADALINHLGLPEKHIQVIYNPVVRPELWEKASLSLDHPWFESGQPPVILSAGRLSRQKDFETLIRAFAQVKQHLPARLVILGEGSKRPQLESLISSLNLHDDVALPGFQINPYNYMSKAGVFVLSSLWEGLPNCLIEAMALGTPVVATDCPSGPVEILQGGRYGTLVPMRDSQALASGIIKCLTKPDQFDLNEARAPFDKDIITRSYLDVLLPNRAD